MEGRNTESAAYNIQVITPVTVNRRGEALPTIWLRLADGHWTWLKPTNVIGQTHFQRLLANLVKHASLTRINLHTADVQTLGERRAVGDTTAGGAGGQISALAPDAARMQVGFPGDPSQTDQDSAANNSEAEQP